MNERLLIVSAGDFGREVFCWAMHISETERLWTIGGFLDNRPQILDGFDIPSKIIGDPETHIFEERDRVVVAIGDPKQRKKFVDILKRRGAKFTTIIHPSAIIGLQNSWGEGCIFCPGSVVTTNVKIGEHVIFNIHSGAGHDAEIGSFCTLSGHVDITGHVRLGEGVFLGSHASVMPSAEVGDYAVIGAGSVVLRKVAAYTTVFGVPAKEIWKANPPHANCS
jgi:sugar O-acyltransferase (sialic acid O-acetyltransferase NeuD family)